MIEHIKKEMNYGIIVKRTSIFDYILADSGFGASFGFNIYGFGGNDLIFRQSSNDNLYGGSRDDTLVVS
ncbi:MAG: hypothetical protein GY798_04370 [Hyphomicrobiales bacterium]|nr:hypothetical protein [Hyphomicrobiales bacterium]